MPTAQIQNETIYALPHLYITGLAIISCSLCCHVICVAPGAARDSTNSIDMVVGLQNYFGIDNPASTIPRLSTWFIC